MPENGFQRNFPVGCSPAKKIYKPSSGVQRFYSLKVLARFAEPRHFLHLHLHLVGLHLHRLWNGSAARMLLDQIQGLSNPMMMVMTTTYPYQYNLSESGSLTLQPQVVGKFIMMTSIRIYIRTHPLMVSTSAPNLWLANINGMLRPKITEHGPNPILIADKGARLLRTMALDLIQTYAMYLVGTNPPASMTLRKRTVDSQKKQR